MNGDEIKIYTGILNPGLSNNPLLDVARLSNNPLFDVAQTV